MSIHYEDDSVTLHHGDCMDVLRGLPDASVDAVVTDPPYGLGFMGREWDDLPPGEPWARECLRVLKPGGHLLAFGGTRTWHRLACAVEDAGFEVRDSIAWMYGSGFPKSLDVSKAIDKAAGAEREVVGTATTAKGAFSGPPDSTGSHIWTGRLTSAEAATPDAERWQGWGTALKPAFEPIVVARKPLAGNVAANVLEHGTGALNIDGSRVGDEERTYSTDSGMNAQRFKHGARPADYGRGRGETATVSGRWPTNVVLDDAMGAELDEESGTIVDRNGGRGGWREEYVGAAARSDVDTPTYRGEGGASRFFPTFRYEAKAPKSERPRYTRSMLRLRTDLTPEQVDHVRARLAEAGVQVD